MSPSARPAAPCPDAFCTTGTSPTRGTTPAPDPVRYELVGPVGAPLVVVLGGISASRHVTASSLDPEPGWWQAQVGPHGQAIDTRCHRVLSFDFVPVRPPAGSPTTEDQARALGRLLDHLGEERIELLVGASYGGMVGLAFAALHPRRLRRLLTIGAAHRPHAMAIAWRSLQRRTVRLGIEAGRAGAALEIARGLAMTTYRSAAELENRFAARPAPGARSGGAVGPVRRFAVEDYLEARGRAFAARFCAATFLRLSESIDLHRVDPARVRVPATLVAVDTDALVPPWLVEELAAEMRVPVRVVHLSSTRGHDAFLTDVEPVGRIVRQAVSEASS